MAAVYLILFPAILSSLFGLTSQHEQQLPHQLQEANFKVAQLEVRLEEIIQNITARDVYLDKCEKQILEMEKKINDLQTALFNLKSDLSPAGEKIRALEEEVRMLWTTMRKNNFDIHVLESKAREAEDRLELVTSKVEKMGDIVSEQWIQIQQFEQALQLREMRALKVQRQARHSRCTFMKFLNDLSGKYLPDAYKPLGSHLLGKGSALESYISKILPQLKRFYSTAKEFHYELQGFVKREMKRHEFTSALANKELVFFVASALIVFPILIGWMLLSSQLS